MLLFAGISQSDQCAELYTLAGVVGVWVKPAPIGHSLTDSFSASSLACGQVGGFKTQCVVFVFSDIFFVSRRFMGLARCLFHLSQVFGQP